MSPSQLYHGGSTVAVRSWGRCDVQIVPPAEKHKCYTDREDASYSDGFLNTMESV